MTMHGWNDIALLMQAIMVAGGIAIFLLAVLVVVLIWFWILPAIGRGIERLWLHLTRQ